MESIKYQSIDEYISLCQPEIKGILEELREAIKSAAPVAKEVISYNMPAFKQNGVLVYFAVAKNHIGFYPTSSPIIVFADALKEYKTSKGAIQFPIDKPIPYDLVKAIVKYRLDEDREKSLMRRKI
jgi:uncharacterized protein YdhG (YjbR/CyaY superfamily)